MNLCATQFSNLLVYDTRGFQHSPNLTPLALFTWLTDGCHRSRTMWTNCIAAKICLTPARQPGRIPAAKESVEGRAVLQDFVLLGEPLRRLLQASNTAFWQLTSSIIECICCRRSGQVCMGERHWCVDRIEGAAWEEAHSRGTLRANNYSPNINRFGGVSAEPWRARSLPDGTPWNTDRLAWLHSGGSINCGPLFWGSIQQEYHYVDPDADVGASRYIRLC